MSHVTDGILNSSLNGVLVLFSDDFCTMLKPDLSISPSYNKQWPQLVIHQQR